MKKQNDTYVGRDTIYFQKRQRKDFIFPVVVKIPQNHFQAPAFLSCNYQRLFS